MNWTETTAQVIRISPLTDHIIELLLAPEHYIDYQAGQYLQLLSKNECLCYSIANAPLGAHNYELHIRHEHSNPYDQPLFAEMKQRGLVDLRLPFGSCHLNNLDSKLPIIFIAGGTGFSPVKAMIEQLLATGDQRIFSLFWGGSFTKRFVYGR